MTDKGLNAFKDTSVKLGADISVAAGPVGTGAEAQTADILAFSRSKGLYGGVSLQGAVITARDEWNTAFYGKPMTPSQILFQKTAIKPEAEPLRRDVARLFGGASQTTGSLQRDSMER
jgi:lipid-binding SYLF domain-containing protein